MTKSITSLLAPSIFKEVPETISDKPRIFSFNASIIPAISAFSSFFKSTVCWKALACTVSALNFNSLILSAFSQVKSLLNSVTLSISDCFKASILESNASLSISADDIISATRPVTPSLLLLIVSLNIPTSPLIASSLSYAAFISCCIDFLTSATDEVIFCSLPSDSAPISFKSSSICSLMASTTSRTLSI